jgi:hypothetical protein
MFNRSLLALVASALTALAFVPAVASAQSTLKDETTAMVAQALSAPTTSVPVAFTASRKPIRILMHDQTRAETDHTCDVEALQATADYVHRFGGHHRRFSGRVACQHTIAYPCRRDHTRRRIMMCYATFQLHWKGGPWDGRVIEYRRAFNYRWIGRHFWQPRKYVEPWYPFIIN